MDSLDLLARENEFKKLNKQLEKKTESLMKQIEHVMQKQDFFSEFSPNLLSSFSANKKKHCCGTSPSSEHSTPTKSKNLPKKPPKSTKEEESTNITKTIDNNNSKKVTEDPNKNTECACCVPTSRQERISQDLEFLYAFVSVSVQEKVLPQAFLKDRATVENVCKFLSSKVKLMQEQIDKLQATINKKAAQCEVHLTHQAELESERMTLLNKSNNHQAAAADMKAKYLVVQKKLEEKDRLYKEQRSETDKLASEVKRLRNKNTSLEARCASLEDSAATLKHQLESAKKVEKDYRESTRSLASSHQAAICNLEQRIKCLTSRVNKQEKLIHNLREQRALLMAEGAFKALEKEYTAFLMKDF